MEPNYGYKHTRGFIIFLIIIFCGWVVVAHSQTSYTGNLVGSTWSNGYSVPELTCWKAGDPNCSPGTPYVRPDGSINFSYSATELYQARALADVLPYSGTGLMVTGFQYNWRSKNGNGWDDGRLDTLQAYVQMYSKSGQWIESQTYSLNFLHNWTDFSWSGTFSKERRGSDLGTILYGFYGKDNNYWVGPYGPEVTNVSFSLRYQPDPCVVNPLHSTECPGFMSAINRPIPGIQSDSTTSTVSTSSTSLTASSSSTALGTAMSVIKLNAQREQGIVDAAVELATGMIGSESRQSTMVSSTVSTLAQPQKRVASATTDSGSAGQEQDLTVSSMTNLNTAQPTQTMSSTSQKTNNRTTDSVQNNQEQDVVATTLVNSGIGVASSIQSPVSQKSNTRSTDSVQNNQEQDLAITIVVNSSFSASVQSPVSQKSNSRATDSVQINQDQEVSVTTLASSNSSLSLSMQPVQVQKFANKITDSVQNSQEQEVVATTLVNSSIGVASSTQSTLVQRFTNKTTDAGQNSQDQDTSSSSVSYNTVPVLAQVQPSTGQRVQNTAVNSSQTTTDTESMAVSSTVSSVTILASNLVGQTQRTNTKMIDASGQQDQDQFTTPPAQATMGSTAPAAPITVVRTVARSQDSQTNYSEQEQTQTVSVTSTTAIVPVQVPTIQKAIQRSDAQAKTDVANDTTNIVDQFIAQNTAVSQATVSTTAVSQPGPARAMDSSMIVDTESNNQVQIAIIKMPEIAVTVQADQVNTGLPERPPTEQQLPIASIATVATVSAPVIAEVSPVSEPIRPPQTETPAADTPTNTIANALIDRTNPLNDMLNGQQQMAQSGAVFAGPAVKSGTADNDLAGGVSISQIARVPAGFDVYQNLAIREIAFYQPREIYRGQRTVDNVRALRSLGQDARHQEMVDQQYRR